MKKFKTLCIIMLMTFTACKQTQNNAIKNNDFNYKYLTNKIKESENKINQVNCDFNSISNFIKEIGNQGIPSIPIAEKVVTRCISSLDSAKRDELYVLFNTFIEKVANNISDSLETKYDSITNKLNDNIDDNEIKEFKKCLDLCNLQLTASEGNFYIEPQNDYCYKLFKNKVSPALEEYLKLLSTDRNEQIDEDAELLVSFDEVYKRLLTWEDFNNKYQKFILKKEALNIYNIYLTIFLSGEENTPVFDYDNKLLLPEVKDLYEKIISKNENRRSTKIVSEYFSILKASKFKQTDKTIQFLKKKGIEME